MRLSPNMIDAAGDGFRAPVHLTWATATAEAALLGFRLQRTGYDAEVRVCRRGDPEARAAYCDGLAEAVRTMRDMARAGRE